MTDHLARLYAGAAALLVFFVVWAVVAARPWAEAGETDPRMASLERREQKLMRETRRVNRVVERRFVVYRKRLARRRKEIAAAKAAAAAVTAAPATSGAAPVAAAPAAAPPPVAVTAAPPVTSTGSS
jgi:hypothetical protein